MPQPLFRDAEPGGWGVMTQGGRGLLLRSPEGWTLTWKTLLLPQGTHQEVFLWLRREGSQRKQRMVPSPLPASVQGKRAFRLPPGAAAMINEPAGSGTPSCAGLQQPHRDCGERVLASPVSSHFPCDHLPHALSCLLVGFVAFSFSFQFINLLTR